MHEHEWMYEHEYEHEREHGESEEGSKLGEDAVEISDIDEAQARHISLGRCRLLVGAFYASFLACLAALWFSGTLLSAPDGFLSFSFLQFVATHRLLVLIIPAVILVVCYALLRHLTGEIMTTPERYLDERQKMLRDQAHRSAFKVVKLACVLIPGAFLLPHLPWFNQPAPVVPVTMGNPYPMYTIMLHQVPNITSQGIIWKAGTQPGALLITTIDQPFQNILRFAPATTTEIALAGGLLLLCLLLVASALPMTVLAWKGEV